MLPGITFTASELNRPGDNDTRTLANLCNVRPPWVDMATEAGHDSSGGPRLAGEPGRRGDIGAAAGA